MQCYTELITPTAITHAVALPFLAPHARNLIVAKTSLLQIFSLQSPKRQHEHQGESRKLRLVGEYPLAGTVTSLASIKAIDTKTGGDALLISFRDAKLSLLEWDSDNHRTSTISIHYYEGENLINQPLGPSLGECETILTVDPSSRCAALKFGARHMAIIPFKQLGDDLADDAEELEAEFASLRRTTSGAKKDENNREGAYVPYRASFVLPLTTLDPSLTHPVDLKFLHEYRAPTLGILSAPTCPSSALLESRRDNLTYTVFTLDVEQRASTNLVSLSKLPSDLWKVYPLPLPIGGVLLVGTNEFIHVDQNGKPVAVAVNEFAMMASSFGMIDQSHLELKLEGCEIEPLDTKTGDLLIILRDASLAILSFKKLGINVSGIEVTPVDSDRGGNLMSAAPSCVASLTSNTVFVGSDSGDSSLLLWSSAAPSSSRKRSHAEMLGQEADEQEAEAEEIDEDDLYAPVAETAKTDSSQTNAANTRLVESYAFSSLDNLSSIGPIHDICFGRTPSLPLEKLEILASVGRQRASRLAVMSKELVPEKLRSTVFQNAKNAWKANTQGPKDHYDSERNQNQELLFLQDEESTKIYTIKSQDSQAIDGDNEGHIASPKASTAASDYIEHTGTEFEHEGETIDIGTLHQGSRLVQCRRHEVRTYDAVDLSLSEIIPMTDDMDVELKIVHTSFGDPYLLVLRDDGSIQILSCNGNGEVEPLDFGEDMTSRKWQSGCVFTGELTRGEHVAFLLGEDGGLSVVSLPDCKVLYTATMLPHLPPVLTADAPQRRPGAKDSLVECLVTNLGSHGIEQTYLILRNSIDDLTIYEPFHAQPQPSESAWCDGLKWRKAPWMHNPKYDDITSEEAEGRPAALRSTSIGQRQMIFVPGSPAYFIVKEPHSLPHAIPLGVPNVKALIPTLTTNNSGAFAALTTEEELIEYALAEDIDFSTGWVVRKLALGVPHQEIRQVAFHEERGMYVVATCRDVDFYFSEDDIRHQEQDDISLRPQVPQYTLHLLSAKTRNIIHSFEMPYEETVTALKVMTLEISEHSHEQRPLIVVGTAVQRGEDMPAKGVVCVFEILDVVPDPDVPESGYHLHPIAREETKGAVTALEPFGHGLIGTAQGQKIMIRGLKEDGSCLPVAFLDAQCHTTQLKTLANSGLWFAGDAWKGVWFGGFVEEPYKLSVLGKSRTQMEVVAADFLPFDGQLFLCVIDAAMDLHILQYDPENPKSVSGTKLLHRSTFHVGHFPTSMTLLPSTLILDSETPDAPFPDESAKEESQNQPTYQLLITSLTGSISLLTPTHESSYRRLGALQTNLTSILEHTASLNPRAYRAVEGEGLGSRGVLDGGIVRRITELGSARRAEVLARAGSDVWTLRADLEALGGEGMVFL